MKSVHFASHSAAAEAVGSTVGGEAAVAGDFAPYNQRVHCLYKRAVATAAAAVVAHSFDPARTRRLRFPGPGAGAHAHCYAGGFARCAVRTLIHHASWRACDVGCQSASI